MSLNPLLNSFLYLIGGEVAIEVGIELINNESEDITDEDITENIKDRLEGTGVNFEPDEDEILKLNTVRKTLYKLYSHKLAQFRRIRDKSTGWFIYFWWHEFDLLEDILSEKKKLLLRKLRDRLQHEETNYFFRCGKCGLEKNYKYRFDEAFELNFRCPDCNSQLEAQDNSKILLFLKEKIILLQKLNIIVEKQEPSEKEREKRENLKLRQGKGKRKTKYEDEDIDEDDSDEEDDSDKKEDDEDEDSKDSDSKDSDM